MHCHHHQDDCCTQRETCQSRFEIEMEMHKPELLEAAEHQTQLGSMAMHDLPLQPKKRQSNNGEDLHQSECWVLGRLALSVFGEGDGKCDMP